MTLRVILCAINRHSAPHPYFSWQRDGIWEGECPVCLALIQRAPGGRWRRKVPAGA